MLLANAFRSLCGCRTEHHPNPLKPQPGHKSQRLSVEPLEERLPPGDALMGGFLAHGLFPERAVEFVPVARATTPAPDQWLAEPPDFALLPGITGATAEVPFITAERCADTSADRIDSAAFVRAAALRDVPTSEARHLGDSGGLSIPVAAPPPLAPPAPFLVTPPMASYFLNQAASAAAPAVDPDSVLPANVDDGARVRSAGVHALFNLGHPTTGPFPANVFTVSDHSHNTGRRVNLPLPDCAVYVSDCEDVAVLNELDGFNLQPRLSVPFSGPIDVNSVTSATVFLVSLGSTVRGQGYMPRGTVVGINQVVWDVATNILHVESDQPLAQHTRFALIVTNGIRDADGDRVEAAPEFRRFRQTVPQPYKRELLDAVREARRLGVRERDIVTASVFTTQSATAVLEKIRDQIKAGTPDPADFLLGPNGERTVFNLDDVTSIGRQGQNRVNPPGFVASEVSVAQLGLIPKAVGRIAFGKFTAPSYLTEDRRIPAVGTRTGIPVVQGAEEIYFDLYLPAGEKPAAGWPVVIFGTGSPASRHQATSSGAFLAAHGIATISINRVGHGDGPLSTLTVNLTSGDPVTFSAGGRGIDLNGDNVIGADEGFFAHPSPRGLVGPRDGSRQTAADMMQLVRVIEVGVDVDGDGTPELDPSRISYFGRSAGGKTGTVFLGVEPDVRVGVLHVAGGSGVEFYRFSTATPRLGRALAARVPSLVNAPGITEIDGVSYPGPYHNDNKPLRDGVPFTVRLEDGTSYETRSPVVNTVAGAAAIQEHFEHREWVQVSGDQLAYAPHLRRAPLPGVPAKSILFSFAKGDREVTNPTSTALVRAGDLSDVTTLYRHDLAVAEDPTVTRNPHGFMTLITSTNPLVRDIARAAQEQMAVFFASDGKSIIYPEPARFFEVPIHEPLPEGLNFIP